MAANVHRADTVALSAPLPKVPGYELLELIGAGGMGRVFRARDVRLGRIVAVKMLATGADGALVERFTTEAKAIAQLQHPQIAQLFEYGALEGQPYYVMEYAGGGSLAELIVERPLPPPMAAAIVERLATALGYAHEHGIIHRDLKPANILLSEPVINVGGVGQIALNVNALVVADFGLAKQLDSDVKLTRTGEIVGTPSYMSPEQATGIAGRVGPATDIYSLGAILYELLTGRPPFVGPDSVQTVIMLLSDDPVAPRVLQPKIPADLETICLKCLEKRPARRYATAQDLAADLRRFLDSQPIVARPISTFERLGKWTYRSPWQAAAAGALMLTLVSSLVGVVLLQAANHRTGQANEKLKTANENLGIAKRESDESFALTQESLDRIVDRVRDDLFNVPQAEEVMLATARDSVALRRKLHQLRPNDAVTERQLYNALRSLWLLEWNYGHHAAADQALAELKVLLQRLTERRPDDTRLAAQQIELFAEEAQLLAKQGKGEQASALESKVREQATKLLEKYPNDEHALKLAAQQAGRKIGEAASQGDLDGAIAASRERVELTRRQLQNAPADSNAAVRMELIQHLCGLGDMLVLKRDTAQATAVYDEAEMLRQKLAATVNERRTLVPFMARVQQGLALVDLVKQDLPAAQSKLETAETKLRELVRDFPRDTIYRGTLAGVLLDLVRVDAQEGNIERARPRVAEIAKLLEEVLKEQPQDVTALSLQPRLKQAQAAISQEGSSKSP